MNKEEFYDQLVKAYNPLKGFAIKLTSNREEAEELVQDTYLNALEGEKLFIEGNFLSWLFKIMKNRFLNQKKKEILVKKVMVTTNFPVKDIEYPVRADSAVLLKEILSEIRKLKSVDRDTLILHLKGYQYKEISDTLNVKIGTIKSKLWYTRKVLAKELL